MAHSILSVLRVGAGIVLLLLGIIGLFLPILQGWLFIALAIPLISPEHGKKLIEKIKSWRMRRRATTQGQPGKYEDLMSEKDK